MLCILKTHIKYIKVKLHLALVSAFKGIIDALNQITFDSI